MFLIRGSGCRVMGKQIKQLMDAAAAAGFAMAPEDIYSDDDLRLEQRVEMTPARATALVPLETSTPHIGLLAQARTFAARYSSPAWLLPRLPA